MKRLLSRFLPGRCSRAHLLFVGLLLAVYLATLVFFHVELDVADPLQRAAADAPWHEDISFKNPPPGYMPVRRHSIDILLYDRKNFMSFADGVLCYFAIASVHPGF